MATIQKFYFLDATSPNTGTMPSNSPAVIAGGAVTGDAAGASTARDTSATPGTANPDTESTITAVADTNPQTWGHRRWVSRPLAARGVFTAAEGFWTWSCAWTELNAAHNARPNLVMYVWRPSTGARVGTQSVAIQLAEPGTTQTALNATALAQDGIDPQPVANGDILVFDVMSSFTQSMGVAYTDSGAYNGTTEASTTTCASFINAPIALTLGGYQPRNAGVNLQDPGVLMEKLRNVWRPRRPKLWKPELWLPEPGVI